VMIASRHALPHPQQRTPCSGGMHHDVCQPPRISPDNVLSVLAAAAATPPRGFGTRRRGQLVALRRALGDARPKEPISAAISAARSLLVRQSRTVRKYLLGSAKSTRGTLRPFAGVARAMMSAARLQRHGRWFDHWCDCRMSACDLWSNYSRVVAK